mgnify:CR=1 FL=1
MPKIIPLNLAEMVTGEREQGTAWLLVGGRLAVLHGLGQLLEPTDDLVELETGELVEPGRGEVIATIGTSPSETWVVLPPNQVICATFSTLTMIVITFTFF